MFVIKKKVENCEIYIVEVAVQKICCYIDSIFLGSYYNGSFIE